MAADMITLKSPREIEVMARAGRIVAGTLALMGEIVRPGLSTEDLDAAAETFIRSHDGATPSFKGLYGFPKTLCTSIDIEIVLGEGSIVSVDVGVQLEGLHADSATTIGVGHITPDAARLLAVTQECLAAGIAQARVGNHVGDIGHAVQKVAEGAGTLHCRNRPWMDSLCKRTARSFSAAHFVLSIRTPASVWRGSTRIPLWTAPSIRVSIQTIRTRFVCWVCNQTARSLPIANLVM